jgi:hypothetical protein
MSKSQFTAILEKEEIQQRLHGEVFIARFEAVHA